MTNYKHCFCLCKCCQVHIFW